MRQELKPEQGRERKTWLHVLLIGDVAIVGVPAEYFTSLGIDIKRRSPFKYTFVAELASDWIGYLPDREGHDLGGYQTWMGLHSYAEPARASTSPTRSWRCSASWRQRQNGQGRNAESRAKPAGCRLRSPADELGSLKLADEDLTIELVAAETERR